VGGTKINENATPYVAFYSSIAMKYAETRLNQYIKKNPDYQDLTLAKIAKDVGLDKSTVSRYFKKLSEEDPVHAEGKKRGYRKERIQYTVDFIKQYFKNGARYLISTKRNCVFLIIPIEPYWDPIMGDVVDSEVIEIR
jgi:AraC-like DNA-binding protein